jgi:hypothetical protein
MKNAVSRDIASGFGAALQSQVDARRTAWNGLAQADRYGSWLTEIQTLLTAVNDLRIASGGSAIDLDDYDNPSLPAPPATPNPQAGLEAAWQAFLGARARVRGSILHSQISGWISTQVNKSYHTTGPDVDDHAGSVTVWYEIYPLGGNSRPTHVLRPGMSSNPWREIQYDNGR